MRKNLAVRHRIGKRVRELRRSRGLTQERLAELAGNTWKHIGQIERGQVNVGIDTLAAIAQALEIDVAELFESSKRPAKPIKDSPDESSLIDQAIHLLEQARRTRI